MLTGKQRTQIFKEVVLGTLPSLTTPEAQAYRAELEQEVAEMEKEGIVPEMPVDLFDDDDPLPLNAAPDPGPLDPTATTLTAIRTNMTVDERLWLASMIEAHGEAEVIRMWPSYCVQLGFARSL
ncbi:MAG: hypothetical protein A4C66_04535 [Nitrospira sp. HN-bin3]|uniref:hypothetical protein n=1 Tax=Nitrospira cf. moscoviensis SBR1015 TaxID=96242 RepID=UPI000A0D943F|nr:hypothetical protein [Nitrospira cf. moscoviensis SBR1015]OQW31873.1 MAG: hypothetical protein A4C66_04535 [Nitrospira sp. HN-bin3]